VAKAARGASPSVLSGGSSSFGESSPSDILSMHMLYAVYLLCIYNDAQ
jgi:hypothetical protein